MKITPVAGGGGGQNIGAVSTQSTSPDRLAAAKAVAMGQSPMRMTESDTPIDSRTQRSQQDIRRIKMRVQQSPDRMFDTQQSTTNVVDAMQSATVDNNEGVVSEETKPLSPQFAALAKQRRALQVKERELITREEALKAQPSTDAGGEWTARLKSQPLRVLEEQGVLNPGFYDQLTEYLVSGQAGMNPEIQSLKEEIKALKEGVDKNFVERDTQAEESALTEMLYEAEALAKDGETYQMIRDDDAYDQVLRRIHSHYKKTGQVLDVRSVMDDLENELITKAERYYKIPKLQSKYAPQVQMQPQAQSRQQPQMRTLTNRDTAQVPLDRRTRAMMAAQGLLKRG